MIRVLKPAAPGVLLERGAAATLELCAGYEAAAAEYNRGALTFVFDDSIYAARAVKDALRKAQHNKCAFCESFFGHIGYGDVEHFRPKAGYKQREEDDLRRPGYYWLAYAWENLFYSCQLCNQRFKRNLFPLRDGRRRARSHSHKLEKEQPLLVDPSHVEPSKYLGFREEYAYPIGGCLEGATTIDVLGLNREELVEIRRKRLASLRDLMLCRDLLRKELAAIPNSALSSHLQYVETRLEASGEATGEYAAMAGAFLESAAPPGT
jgi:uncharacterized protein (TIGR02646 family)